MTFGCKRVTTHLQAFNPTQPKGCPAPSAALILPRGTQFHPRPPCRGAQGSRHAEPRSSVTFLGWCFCVPRWVRGRVGLYCGWEAELDVQIWLGGSWTQYFWQGCSLTSSSPIPPHPPTSLGELAEGLAGPSTAKQEVGSSRQGGEVGKTPQYPL